METPKGKVDYRDPAWIDEFNAELRFIRGVAEVTGAALVSNGPVARETAGTVLCELSGHFDTLDGLVQGIYESIRWDRRLPHGDQNGLKRGEAGK